MVTVFEQLIAGIKEDIAAREDRISLRLMKALSASVPPARNVALALTQPGCGVIAEIKCAHFGKDAGITTTKSAARLAQQFEAGGARLIGCHTERQRRKGSLRDVWAVRQAVNVPIICKDFILDPYQVHEARFYGADMIPLLAAALEQSRLESLLDRVESLGMTALVEVHTPEEATRAITAGARVVGVSCRDLRSMRINHDAFAEIAPGLPQGTIKIALSGVRSARDLMSYAGAGADAVVIGDELVTATNPCDECRKFVSVGQHPACPSVY